VPHHFAVFRSCKVEVNCADLLHDDCHRQFRQAEQSEFQAAFACE